MNLEQSFTVAASIDDVWTALLDVERVASCLPGAEITDRRPDGAYEGTFTVKLGPTTAAYKGSLRLESVDEAGRVATMSARGSDKRGQGGATATIVSTLREEGAGTVVDVASEFTITGRLARFGRSGMMEDISRRLLEDFAACLQSRLGAEPGTEPEARAMAPQPAVPAAVGAGAPALEPSGPVAPGEPSEPQPPTASGREPSEPQPPTASGREPSEPPEISSPPAAPSPSAAGPAPSGAQEGEPPAPRQPPGSDPFGPIGPTAPPEEEEPPRRESVPPPSSSRQPPPLPTPPVNGLSLFLSALGDRLKALFRRRR